MNASAHIRCDQCLAPIRADAGRRVCLSCLDGRPGPTRPVVAGREVSVVRRARVIVLRPLSIAVLKALTGPQTHEGPRTHDEVAGEVGRQAGQVALVLARLLRSGLVVRDGDRWTVTAEAGPALATGYVVRRWLATEALDVKRTRMRRFRERRKVVANGGA